MMLGQASVCTGQGPGSARSRPPPPPQPRFLPHPRLAAATTSNSAARQGLGLQRHARGRRGRAPGGVAAAVTARYEPFPFDESDYHRVGLQVIQGKDEGVSAGYLLFMRESSPGTLDPAHRYNGLLVSVGGDSFQALLLLLQRRAAPRPLTLDLLWAVLERAEAVDGEGWSVLRVAVVGMTSTAFVGRLWLGSSATGEVFWDCDIRPSDATWLAVKSNAPIFVHRQVLNNQALGIDRSPPEGGARAEGGAGAPLDPATLMTTPRPLDPEPLKRLKMELRVALAEEDYAAAARIRDHPFCKLHWAAATARAEGDEEGAQRFERQLVEEVARAEVAGEEGRRQADPPGM